MEPLSHRLGYLNPVCFSSFSFLLIPWKVISDGSRAWASVIHVGDPDWVPGFRFLPGTAPDYCGHLKKWENDSLLSPFQIKKERNGRSRVFLWGKLLNWVTSYFSHAAMHLLSTIEMGENPTGNSEFSSFSSLLSSSFSFRIASGPIWIVGFLHVRHCSSTFYPW